MMADAHTRVVMDFVCVWGEEEINERAGHSGTGITPIQRILHYVRTHVQGELAPLLQLQLVLVLWMLLILLLLLLRGVVDGRVTAACRPAQVVAFGRRGMHNRSSIQAGYFHRRPPPLPAPNGVISRSSKPPRPDPSPVLCVVVLLRGPKYE